MYRSLENSQADSDEWFKHWGSSTALLQVDVKPVLVYIIIYFSQQGLAAPRSALSCNMRYW